MHSPTAPVSFEQRGVFNVSIELIAASKDQLTGITDPPVLGIYVAILGLVPGIYVAILGLVLGICVTVLGLVLGICRDINNPEHCPAGTWRWHVPCDIVRKWEDGG
jgi:hypothetical protein